MTMQRIITIATVLILVGAGIAFFVSYLQKRGADTNDNVNIRINVNAVIEEQRVVQQGNQEGDETFYSAHVSDLTLGRLGIEQPTTDDSGNIVYRSGDKITYNLVTPESMTAPFKVRYEVYDSSDTRVMTGDPLDINPGSNAACCILAPETGGEYTLRLYADDTLFAARYFVVRE